MFPDFYVIEKLQLDQNKRRNFLADLCAYCVPIPGCPASTPHEAQTCSRLPHIAQVHASRAEMLQSACFEQCTPLQGDRSMIYEALKKRSPRTRIGRSEFNPKSLKTVVFPSFLGHFFQILEVLEALGTRVTLHLHHRRPKSRKRSFYSTPF